jgi:hypothetical protein
MKDYKVVEIGTGAKEQEKEIEKIVKAGWELVSVNGGLGYFVKKK